MDNIEFDNHFSDHLNQEQDFGFQESDWTDLNERMEAQKGKRRRFILPFWITAAASVLLGGLFYLWYANRMISHEVEALRTEISKLSDEKSTDTVFQEVVIVKTDTVFLNSNSTKSIIQNFASEDNKLHSNHNEQPGTLVLSEAEESAIEKQPQTFTQNEVEGLKQSQTLTLNEIEGSASQEQPQTLNKVNDLQSNAIFAEAQTKMPILDIPLFFIKQKPTKKRIKFNPDLQLGLLAGQGFADIDQPLRNQSGITLASNDPNINKRSVYSAGLQGELGLGDHIRVVSGIAYERLKLDVNNYQNYNNIPSIELFAISADAQNLDLEEFENAAVLQQTLNYDFGLKYAFASKGKWRPYLGTAILGQSNLKRNIEYAVGDDSSGNYDPNRESLNYSITSAPKSKPVFFYGVRGALGTEYSISDHFGLHIEGYYNHAFKTFDDRHLTLFGLKAGVYFKF